MADERDERDVLQERAEVALDGMEVGEFDDRSGRTREELLSYTMDDKTREVIGEQLEEVVTFGDVPFERIPGATGMADESGRVTPSEVEGVTDPEINEDHETPWQ